MDPVFHAEWGEEPVRHGWGQGGAQSSSVQTNFHSHSQRLMPQLQESRDGAEGRLVR